MFGHDHVSGNVDAVPFSRFLQSLLEDVARAGSPETGFAMVAAKREEVETARFLESFEAPRHIADSYADGSLGSHRRGENCFHASGNGKNERKSKSPPCPCKEKRRRDKGGAAASKARGAPSLHMLGAGVPSDHLSAPTRNTVMGGKLRSWGYDCSDKYQ
jgi:hypothetical protein